MGMRWVKTLHKIFSEHGGVVSEPSYRKISQIGGRMELRLSDRPDTGVSLGLVTCDNMSTMGCKTFESE